MVLQIAIPKIMPPRLPKVLYRERLLERLDQHEDRKLILILGQAAQGKSTLAASYAKASAVPSAWVNLGREDSDAINLLYLLVQSLRHALTVHDPSFTVALPFITLGPQAEPPLHRDWARTIFSSVHFPLRVVLDGLDRLSTNASSYGFLKVLVEETPPQVRFLMLSREDPPIDVSALKVKQEAYVLNNQDLAFTLEEVMDFFKKVRRLALSPDALRKIHQATEGWAGGLILLSESLGRDGEHAGGGPVLPELPDHFSAEVFRYFGEEIFAAQSPEVQKFLIRSSILDDVEPNLVSEMLGTPRADQYLRDLARRNLFVASLYDCVRGWVFTYHQLFRDFLRSKLNAEVDQSTRKDLHLKAGALYEQRGDLEKAVHHYLDARAYTRAIAVLEGVGLHLIKQGRTGDLTRWLERLPESELQENPWLLFYHFMTGRYAASDKYLFSLKRALQLFEQRHDHSGVLLVLACLIEASMTRGGPAIPPVYELVRQGEELLQSLNPGGYPYERAVLLLQIGFVHTMRTGATAKGLQFCQHAHQLARELRDVPLQLSAMVHAVAAAAILGQFPEAEGILRKAEKLLARCPQPELRFYFLLQALTFDMVSGALEPAATRMEEIKALLEEHGLTHLYPPTLLHDALLKLKLECYDEAEELANNLASISLALGNLFLNGTALWLLGWTAYRRGDYDRAWQVLKKSSEVLSLPEARSDLHLGFLCVLLGLTACHLDPNGEAEGFLLQALRQFQEFPNPLFLREAHLAMALWRWHQERRDEAALHLQAGLSIARDRGYRHWHLLNREDFMRCMMLALELEIDGVTGYALEMLTSHLTDDTTPELARLVCHPTAAVAEQGQGVRRAIHRRHLPRMRIETFGGFRLVRDATPVVDKEWQANQPKLLLKAIVARGCRGIPKDLLMEDLWPDILPETGERNLKVILHRLRKFLEPTPSKEFRSSYVHLRANLISLDEELFRVDVDDFLSWRLEGRTKEQQADPKGAWACYEEAVNVYRGDFLPEELYNPWADLRREELRRQYLQLLYHMAEIEEKRRSTSRKAIDLHRRIIRTDPLQEPSYQKLMVLYCNRGMRNAALAVYDQCRQALDDGLKQPPDALTTAIYRKALELS